MNAYSSGDVVHHPLVADVGEGFVRRHALGVLGHALHSPGEPITVQSRGDQSQQSIDNCEAT